MTRLRPIRRLIVDGLGYRNAYLTNSEELGAARMLADRYRYLFEASAAERLAPRTEDEGYALAPDAAAALVIGNGRSGSTWLLTNFDRLPDVVARREINWRVPGTTPSRIQVQIDGSTSSIRKAIAAATGFRARRGGPNIPIAGAKLIFDPYGYPAPEVFAHLSAIIEPGTKLIALRRSYLAMWLSWKARGVHHEVDPEVLKTISIPEEDARTLQAARSPEIRRIELTLAGQPLGAADAGGSRDAIRFPLRDAIDDMLLAYWIDAATAALVRERSGLLLAYEEIGSRFAEVAAFIGSKADPQTVAEIANAPLTRRLDRLRPELVNPSDILRELDQVLGNALAHGAPWKWRSRTELEIESIPGLAPFLGRFPALPRTGWPIRKPIYPI